MRSTLESAERPLTHTERRRVAGVLTVAALVTLACQASCEHTPPAATPRMAMGAVSRETTAQSVYKIIVDVSLRPVPTADVIAMGGSEYGGSAAAPEIKHSTWWGTAWVVADNGQHAYMMTAGHVCETRKQIVEDPGPLGPMFGLSKTTYDVVGVEYKLIGSDSTVYNGATVLADDDDVDLCALSIAAPLGPALPIATAEPKYAERGWYVGAPHGYWGHGLAGIYELTYTGRGNPFTGMCGDGSEDNMKRLCDNDSELFSASEGAPGASGSPMIVDGKVVGVFNMAPPNFHTLTLAVPWDVMRRFMAGVMHNAT